MVPPLENENCMRIVMSSIVEEFMNKIALSIRVNVYDWTAERAIITSTCNMPVTSLGRSKLIKSNIVLSK